SIGCRTSLGGESLALRVRARERRPIEPERLQATPANAAEPAVSVRAGRETHACAGLRGCGTWTSDRQGEWLPPCSGLGPLSVSSFNGGGALPAATRRRHPRGVTVTRSH